jgi:LacI family transcriptional regulator
MENSENKPLTITDLAKQLAVSTATISAVLNNRYKERRIASKTVDRVRLAIRESRFMPNISARRLRSKGNVSHLVIAIITSFEAPLPLISVTLNALQKINQEKSFRHLAITTTVDMFHVGHIKDLPGLLDGTRFNGAIIANTIAQDDIYFARHTLPMPVVFIGREIPGYSSVRELAVQTGRQAAEILFSQGCTKLAVLHGQMLTQTTEERIKGFIEDVKGITGKDPDILVADNLCEKAGYDVMMSYLSKNQCDGLYSITDSLAVGAYMAIKKNKLRIPEDIAVIGTGDVSVSEYLDPPLSTFTRSQYNMHEEAVRLLLRQMIGEISSPTQIIIPVIPVLRESTHRKK